MKASDLLRLATEENCACGGSGPGEGCVWCDLWHDLHEVIDEEADQQRTRAEAAEAELRELRAQMEN